MLLKLFRRLLKLHCGQLYQPSFCRGGTMLLPLLHPRRDRTAGQPCFSCPLRHPSFIAHGSRRAAKGSLCSLDSVAASGSLQHTRRWQQPTASVAAGDCASCISPSHPYCTPSTLAPRPDSAAPTAILPCQVGEDTWRRTCSAAEWEPLPRLEPHCGAPYPRPIALRLKVLLLAYCCAKLDSFQAKMF